MVARRRLRLVALAIGMAAASPASAITGLDLLSDVCLATFPHFDGASERVEALHGHAITYDGRLLEQVEAEKRLSWAVSDDPTAKADRFLVDVAWGSFNSLPAASCVIGDKQGFTLAELQERFPIRQLLVHDKKVLYETVADAVVQLPDGRRLWLTLWDLHPRENPGPDTRIAIATLMSSDYLNALMEKDR
jgi:hypothetical protein